MKDVAPVFDLQYPDGYIDSIKQKIAGAPVHKLGVWTDYERSCQLLEEGIPAIKYNFTN